MMELELKTINQTNITSDGKVFSKTVICLIDSLPHCINCGIEIKENDNCFLCMQCHKFFCYECNTKDSFVCHKYLKESLKNHSDWLVKPKLKKVNQ
jgi:hypothetical protein